MRAGKVPVQSKAEKCRTSDNSRNGHWRWIAHLRPVTPVLGERERERVKLRLAFLAAHVSVLDVCSGRVSELDDARLARCRLAWGSQSTVISPSSSAPSVLPCSPIVQYYRE
jgi:hypothetical protein